MQSSRRSLAKVLRLSAIASVLLTSHTASALEFDLAGTALKIDNLFTVGALFRAQERDISNVGKSTAAKILGRPLTISSGPVAGSTGLCVARVGDDGVNGPADANNTYRGDTCSGTRPLANERAIAAPGSFSPNADNGNLNFDKWDVAYGTAKLTSDFSMELGGFNLFARTTGYFDGVLYDFDETHPDTTFQSRRARIAKSVEERSGLRLQPLDYFVAKRFDIGEKSFNIKVGNQVLNWGESAFLLANSLNAINPPNQALLRIPGFDVKELTAPVGMVLLEGDIVDGLGFQAFYQYDWKPVVADPIGSYFSVSDTLGEGQAYAMLSFAKAPDDPLGLYEPFRNPDDPTAVLGSRSSRTLFRDYQAEIDRAPSNGSQYGLAFKSFFQGLNNGTEIGLYFANYHARVPSASGFAAQASCLNNFGARAPSTNPAQNVPNLIADCQVPNGNVAALIANTARPGSAPYAAAGAEALPLDTARLVVEYPENIKMYGMSFNTTVGDYALSGEYAYRPNLPIQLHTTDVVFALLQPAFPAQDYSIGAAVLPGRRTAVPDFIGQYRNPGCDTNGKTVVTTDDCIQAGQYVQGFERLGIGQGEVTLLKTIGGDNPLGASQITLLLEMGFTHLPDFPDLSELQFNGGGVDTHISAGIGGNVGINPRDIRANPDDPSSHRCDTIPPSPQQTQAQATAACYTLLQNPISQASVDISGFGTDLSYGYRLVTLTRYDSAIFGANIELLNGIFHDLEGVGPGLGQNFVEGRKAILSGIRFDYLSRFIGEVRYTWYTGGANRDAIRDRDNLFVWLGYQF